MHDLRPVTPTAPWPLAALLATPALLAYNLSPSSTLLNQLCALAAWGLLMLLAPVAQAVPGSSRSGGPAWLRWPLLGTAGVLLVAGVAWSLWQGLPDSLARSSMAVLLAALAVLAWARHSTLDGASVGRGLVLAGALSVVVGLVQVFLPAWADGSWVARSGLAGRAVGNLRQPNHLSTVLLWGLIWWVPLAERLQRQATPGQLATWWALAAALVLGVVLTASRTGIVGIVLLAVWGLADHKLARRVRAALVSAPLVYLLFWGLMAVWAHQTQHTFGGEARLAEADLSASRFGIWSNTLALIRAQPWTGVGWGEFNFAWTLTPFPDRPVAFFDHSHNLPLNLLAELGLPLGGAVLLLLLAALAQAGLQAWRRQGDDGVGARAAFVMVLLVGLHSLLEYPLWYAYFLLPTAWAWGHALRPAARPDPGRREGAWGVRLAGAVMVLGAAFAAWDYGRVVVIYTPSANAAPLPQRIARGQDSFFFAHHADYAAATSTEPPSQAMGAFETTTHALLDTRLMMDWTRALAESGHLDKARHVAARLREFRNPAADEFFAPCQAVPPPAPLPVQCQAPTVTLPWRRFLPSH